LKATPESRPKNRLLAGFCGGEPFPRALSGSAVCSDNVCRAGPAARAWFPDKKVVLFLDQFEQWLHAPPRTKVEPGLVRALLATAKRGARLQVGSSWFRDDFWLSVHPLSWTSLEVPSGRRGANQARRWTSFSCGMRRARCWRPSGAPSVRSPRKSPRRGTRRRAARVSETRGQFEGCVGRGNGDSRAAGAPSPKWLKTLCLDARARSGRWEGGRGGSASRFWRRTFSAGNRLSRATAIISGRARSVLKVAPATWRHEGTEIKGPQCAFPANGAACPSSGYARRPRDFELICCGFLDSELRLDHSHRAGGGSARPAGKLGGPDGKTAQYYQLTPRFTSCRTFRELADAQTARENAGGVRDPS